MPITLIMTVLDRALVHLRIALNSSSKLRPTGKRYVVAGHFAQLDAEGKKRAGVCNMFVTSRHPLTLSPGTTSFPVARSSGSCLRKAILKNKGNSPTHPSKVAGERRTNGRRGDCAQHLGLFVRRVRAVASCLTECTARPGANYRISR
jgi:hypothetical protein